MASNPLADQRRYVSPLQVALALGVGETTVKRWCDEGRLPFRRTAGRHRRILVSDVVDLVNRDNLPHLCLSLLTGEPSLSRTDPAALAAQFSDALLAGDPEAGRRLILAAHQSGYSVPRLADELISPVMARIGHNWATGALDVYQEHRATQSCLSGLLALKARLETSNPPDENRPLAAGGGPEFDHYLLANLLVEMTFRELGWRVVNIGPNTPFASFRKAMHELKPRLLWLSCSHLPDTAAFLEGYRALYDEAAHAGVAVAVGGRAVDETLRQQMTFTHFGDRLAHLAAFAQELQPRRP